MAQKQGSPGLEAQPVLFLLIPGQIAPGREGKLVRTLAPWKSPQNRATQEQSPGDACWEDGCRWTGSERVTGCTCPNAPPELATCPEQPVARVGRGESLPMASSPSPLLRVRAKGWPQAGGGVMTSPPGGGEPGGPPHPRTEAPRADSPFLSLQTLARAISSFYAEPRFRNAAAVRG